MLPCWFKLELYEISVERLVHAEGEHAKGRGDGDAAVWVRDGLSAWNTWQCSTITRSSFGPLIGSSTPDVASTTACMSYAKALKKAQRESVEMTIRKRCLLFAGAISCNLWMILHVVVCIYLSPSSVDSRSPKSQTLMLEETYHIKGTRARCQSRAQGRVFHTETYSMSRGENAESPETFGCKRRKRSATTNHRPLMTKRLKRPKR